MWIVLCDPFLMRNLLKCEILGLWIVHGVHWLAKNCLTSQTLQLLFMNSSRNSNICPETSEKKKKNRKMQMQMHQPNPNAHWLIHNLHPLILQIPLLSLSSLTYPWEVHLTKSLSHHIHISEEVFWCFGSSSKGTNSFGWCNGRLRDPVSKRRQGFA